MIGLSYLKTYVQVWLLCFFTQDLAYYLAHRAMHGETLGLTGVEEFVSSMFALLSDRV